MKKYILSFFMIYYIGVMCLYEYTTIGVMQLSGRSNFPYETLFDDIMFLLLPIFIMKFLAILIVLMIVDGWRKLYIYAIEIVCAVILSYYTYPVIDRTVEFVMELNLVHRIFGI